LVGCVCLSQVNKPDFAAEAKYNGQRGMALVDGGEVTLWSRNRANMSLTFPDLTAALATAGRRMVLDGEIVALDETGVRSFSRLQQNRRPTGELLHRVPVRFIVFDVLEVDGRAISREPYSARQEQLTEIESVRRPSGSWMAGSPAPHFRGVLTLREYRCRAAWPG